MTFAKKSLGQNFLIDENIINKISSLIKIEDQNILEVGPGTGNLTRALLKKKPKKFYVIEKDDNLANLLKKEFKDKIIIINDDILKVNENNLSNEKLIVFGNLPYNISTEILCKWIINLNDKKIWFRNFILMFQKEVADRIVANVNSSKYGRLTILTNWKMTAKKITDIDPENFYPKPKVKSSLLYFEPKANFFNFEDSKNLEKVTDIFFQNKRKMIKKPLNILFKDASKIIKKINLDEKSRPQNINPLTFFKISKEYEDELKLK